MLRQECIAFNVLINDSLVNESTISQSLFENLLSSDYINFWLFIDMFCQLQCFIKTSSFFDILVLINFSILWNDNVRSVWKGFFTYRIKRLSAHDNCIFLKTRCGDFLEHFEVTGQLPRDFIVEPYAPVDSSSDNKVERNLAGIHFQKI